MILVDFHSSFSSYDFNPKSSLILTDELHPLHYSINLTPMVFSLTKDNTLHNTNEMNNMIFKIFFFFLVDSKIGLTKSLLPKFTKQKLNHATSIGHNQTKDLIIFYNYMENITHLKV